MCHRSYRPHPRSVKMPVGPLISGMRSMAGRMSINFLLIHTYVCAMVDYSRGRNRAWTSFGGERVASMERDRLGRRRSPKQERGLRPLYPLLPEEWVSKALRVAMSESDWSEFERLVALCASRAPTQARAYGIALASLLQARPRPEPVAGPLDWMDWERRKTLRLLLRQSS
jgi:hypothetical protein